MIDIENNVFTYVSNAVRTVYPKAFVSGEYVDTPATFPAVTIVEADNRVDERYSTTKIEKAVDVMYEVNVYSNKSNGKKAEAKSVANLVDEAFESLGFTRTFRNQMPNLQNASIYRIVMRYSALIIPNDDGLHYIHSR